MTVRGFTQPPTNSPVLKFHRTTVREVESLKKSDVEKHKRLSHEIPLVKPHEAKGMCYHGCILQLAQTNTPSPFLCQICNCLIQMHSYM